LIRSCFIKIAHNLASLGAAQIGSERVCG